MNHMPLASLSIFTDGTFHSAGQGFGWVAVNAPAHFTQSRIVTMEAKKGNGSQSSVMESAAIVDAIAEFAHRNVHLVIHSDSQALTYLIDKYRSGEADASIFLNKPGVISFQDGLRLGSLIATVSFEVRWVKAHRFSFANLVIDQALRIASVDGEGDEAGRDFIATAMEARSARIWGSWRTEDGEFYKGFLEVEAAHNGTAKLPAFSS